MINMTEVLKIVTHTACNFSCNYCFQNEWRSRYNQVMSHEIISNIFSKIKKHGSALEMCSMGGETYLYPQVMNDICEQHKFQGLTSWITFFTNGTILNEDIISLYKKHNDRMFIVITVHKYEDDNYMGQIIHHIKVLQDLSMNFNIVMILTAKASIEKFSSVLLRLLKYVNFVKLTFEYIPQTSFFTKEQLRHILNYFITTSQSIQDLQLRERFSASFKRLFTILDLSLSNMDNLNDVLADCKCLTCGAGTREIVILPNGDIAPCENAVHKIDQTDLVNIKDIDTFHNLYKFPLFSELKRRYLRGVVTEDGVECGKCVLRGVCNECTCEYAPRFHNDIYTKTRERCQFTRDLVEVQLDHMLIETSKMFHDLKNDNTKLIYNLIERNKL